MGDDQGPYQEGKRAGLHPLIVVFGVLLGLWLFFALIVPSSRNKQATGTEGPAGAMVEDPEAAPVIFKVQSTVSDMNAVSLVVPRQATESQVVGLLKRLKKERLAGTLTDLIPDLYEALDVVSREMVGMLPAVTRNAGVERAALNESAAL